MRASSKRVAALAVLLTVGLFTTGCRKAKARSDFHPEEEATQEAKFVDGVSDDTIKLTQVASFTGAQAGLGTEIHRGVLAYFLEANSKGGIHGRKIEVTPIDDKYSAEGGEAGADKALQDNPFLLVASSGTEAASGILKTLQKNEAKKIFLWGSNSGAEVLREGPLANFAFNIRGSLKGAGKDIAEAYSQAGFKKIAIITQDDGFGKSAANGARKAAEEKGFQVVAEVPISKALKPEGGNANDIVTKLRATGADAVVLATTYNPGATFVRDARMAGWNVPAAIMGTPDTMIRYLVAQEKKTGKRMTNGILGCVNVPPVSATDVPAVREYRDLMDKRNPRVPSEIADPNYRPLRYASSSFEGYIMAKVLGEALERAGKNLTRDSLRKAAESIQGWDPGVGQKITFGAGDNQGFDSIWLPGVKNDELTLVTDMKKYLTDKPEPVVVALDEKDGKDTKTAAATTTPAAAANAKTAPAAKH